MDRGCQIIAEQTSRKNLWADKGVGAGNDVCWIFGTTSRRSGKISWKWRHQSSSAFRCSNTHSKQLPKSTINEWKKWTTRVKSGNVSINCKKKKKTNAEVKCMQIPIQLDTYSQYIGCAWYRLDTHKKKNENESDKVPLKKCFTEEISSETADNWNEQKEIKTDWVFEQYCYWCVCVMWFRNETWWYRLKNLNGVILLTLSMKKVLSRWRKQKKEKVLGNINWCYVAVIDVTVKFAAVKYHTEMTSWSSINTVGRPLEIKIMYFRISIALLSIILCPLPRYMF